MNNSIEELSKPSCSSLLAPAGCGKTEAIARAVAISNGRQLILTHTHAGVRSIKRKLKANQVSNSRFNLETIDGWLLKYAASFPSMSGFTEIIPTGDLWKSVRTAANNLFSSSIVREIISTTYNGVFIDEYQDCTLSQHAIIRKLAEIVPVRVLGDPLQGILGFRKDRLVEWNEDVIPIFTPLEELRVPWRWKNKNPELGEWLLKLRFDLLEGKRIDLSRISEITWHKFDPKTIYTITKSCMNKQGTFLAIQMHANMAHNFAKNYGGKLQSMEEMECKDLMSATKTFECSTGLALIQAVIKFIFACMSKKDYLSDVERRLRNPKAPNFSTMKNSLLGNSFQRLLYERDYPSIATILRATLDNKSLNIHRRELMLEMLRSLDTMETGIYTDLSEAAWEVRSRTRRFGGNLGNAIVSRPALIKGLEFDNVLIPNSDTLEGVKNFYVSATRAIHNLTIISSSPTTFFKMI